jgi:hypothetical protein
MPIEHEQRAAPCSNPADNVAGAVGVHVSQAKVFHFRHYALGYRAFLVRRAGYLYQVAQEGA